MQALWPFNGAGRTVLTVIAICKNGGSIQSNLKPEAVTGNEGRQLRGGGVCGSIVIPMVLGSTAVVDVAVAAVEASAMSESTATCAYMGEGKQNPRATDNPKLPHD